MSPSPSLAFAPTSNAPPAIDPAAHPPQLGECAWPFAADSGASSRDLSLPQDFIVESTRRVRMAAWVFAGLWLFVLAMNNVIAWLPGMGGRPENWPVECDILVGVGAASWLLFLAWIPRLQDQPRKVIDVGLMVFVFTAFLTGVVTNWEVEFRGFTISWLVLAILVYPAIAPTSLRKTILAVTLAAAMDPVGLLVAYLRGVPLEYNPLGVLWRYLPTFIAAALALVPVRIIRGLGRQVSAERALGSYHLGERIAHGGMGEVYRATHRMLARPAAVKLVKPGWFGAPASLEARVIAERFRREAETVANLRSVHTVDLYDYGVGDDGSLYYVMELLDGIDLERLVTRFGPLPQARVVHLLTEACESLAEAHALRLLHRDVKPSNVLTCRMGIARDFVKVLDFGLVSTCRRSPVPQGTSPHSALTTPGLVVGTPGYMAPEVMAGDPGVDQRADVYGVGCLAWWLLTGKMVFDAPNAFTMMIRHVQDPPDPPSRHAPFRVSAALDQLVLDCLAKDPAHRPDDASVLLERLGSCDVGEPWTQQKARTWWAEHMA